MKDLFIVHPSVFYDAFRTDYQTIYKDSSTEFLNMLRNHFIRTGKKIAYTSGEVFKKLMVGPLGKTRIIWVIPEYIVNVDFETYENTKGINSSIVILSSKLCITHNPKIVTTNKQIDLEGTTFPLCTPKEAIDIYNHPHSRFDN